MHRGHSGGMSSGSDVIFPLLLVYICLASFPRQPYHPIMHSSVYNLTHPKAVLPYLYHTLPVACNGKVLPCVRRPNCLDFKILPLGNFCWVELFAFAPNLYRTGPASLQPSRPLSTHFHFLSPDSCATTGHSAQYCTALSHNSKLA